jgi:hypothetical protein
MIDCEVISGEHFRLLFGQSMSLNQFEAWLERANLVSGDKFVRQEEEGVTVFDWRSEAISCSAGLQNNALLFVSLRFIRSSLIPGRYWPAWAVLRTTRPGAIFIWRRKPAACR